MPPKQRVCKSVAKCSVSYTGTERLDAIHDTSNGRPDGRTTQSIPRRTSTFASAQIETRGQEQTSEKAEALSRRYQSMRYLFIKRAAIAICAAGIIVAQNPTGDSQAGAVQAQQGRQCMMMGGHLDLDHIAQALNLTDSQKEQARTIFQNVKQSAQPIREELKQNREKLMAAAKASNSEADIQRLATEQGRLLGKLIAIRTVGSAKFYQVLTPEQRVKADQMHEQFRQRVRSENPKTRTQ
jgi:Spy/CpxP family protein refolding chaperone